MISTYFFLTCGDNPGWVTFPESEDTSLEKRNFSTKYRPPPASNEKDHEPYLKKEANGKGSCRTNSLESNEDLKDFELQNIKGDEEYHLDFVHKQEVDKKNDSSESFDSLLKDSTFQFPAKHFCRVCNIEQEYRTRHCHKCQKCIYKYDHHCFWIGLFDSLILFRIDYYLLGGCVGELNHRKFFLFLFFQSIVNIWSFFLVKIVNLYFNDGK